MRTSTPPPGASPCTASRPGRRPGTSTPQICHAIWEYSPSAETWTIPRRHRCQPDHAQRRFDPRKGVGMLVEGRDGTPYLSIAGHDQYPAMDFIIINNTTVPDRTLDTPATEHTVSSSSSCSSKAPTSSVVVHHAAADAVDGGVPSQGVRDGLHRHFMNPTIPGVLPRESVGCRLLEHEAGIVAPSMAAPACSSHALTKVLEPRRVQMDLVDHAGTRPPHQPRSHRGSGEMVEPACVPGQQQDTEHPPRPTSRRGRIYVRNAARMGVMDATPRFLLITTTRKAARRRQAGLQVVPRRGAVEHGEQHLGGPLALLLRGSPASPSGRAPNAPKSTRSTSSLARAVPSSFHTEHRMTDLLREIRSAATVELHPATAAISAKAIGSPSRTLGEVSDDRGYHAHREGGVIGVCATTAGGIPKYRRGAVQRARKSSINLLMPWKEIGSQPLPAYGALPCKIYRTGKTTRKG